MRTARLTYGYRCALMLNNIGVELLENGSHQQAMNTLNDSLIAMKALVNQESSSEFTDTDVTLKNSKVRLQKALKRLQRTKSGAPSDLRTFVYENCFIPDHGLKSFDSIRPTKIALPESEVQFRQSRRDTDLETVVVLSNVGLSYYLVSGMMQEESSQVAEALLKRSFHVLTIASDILANRFAMCNSEAEESRIMTVALLVTGNLMHVCREKGYEEESSRHQQKYLRLGNAIHLKVGPGFVSAAIS